jgi:ABC-type nickel/cobalt efflux system permease component RcnA
VERELALLLTTAASLGLIHALAGPDHYLPFIALAKARRWSMAKTLRVTLLSGIGHVLASLVVGGLGIALGWSLGGLEKLQAVRGDLAAWLLIGLGLAYTAWGVRQAARDRPHSHWHTHADGTAHEHQHAHHAQHAHPHESAAGRRLTPWLLFLVLVLGPCEALIPLLMVPAARGSWVGVAMVASVFALATLIAMTAAVVVGSLGLARLDFQIAARHAHTLAGLTVVACGVAIRLWPG